MNAIRSELTSEKKEDDYERWVDSLPFPLASILWICHAEPGNAEERFRRKLHFFEAFSQFIASIHLSAFASDLTLWNDVRVDLKSRLAGQHLSVDRATFGTWKLINERLVSKCREMLGSDEQLCFELYRCSNRRLLAALTSKKLLTVVQQTNSLRNRWAAHAGAISEADATDVDEKLMQCIHDVRSIFGYLWADYHLLLPGTNEFDEGVFRTEVQILRGTRQPFPWSSVEVLRPMQKGSLHFKSPNFQETLELLPLIKVMEPPSNEQNACYFYNRKDSTGICFQSYHFRSESSVVDEFRDTQKAIGRLFDFST